MEIFQYLLSVLEEDFKVVTVILNILGGTTSPLRHNFVKVKLSSHHVTPPNTVLTFETETRNNLNINI